MNLNNPATPNLTPDLPPSQSPIQPAPNVISTNYSESNKLNSKFKLILITIILVIILIVVGTLFFLKGSIFPSSSETSLSIPQQQSISSVPSLTPNPSTSALTASTSASITQPVTIPGWQSYTYQPLNLSLQYPPGWKVTIYGGLILGTSADFPHIFIASPVNQGSDLMKILDKDVGPDKPTTTVFVAGHQGFERRDSLPGGADRGGTNFYAYTLFNNNQGKIISISLDAYSKNPTDDADYAIYEKLVSSLKELN